MKKKYHIASRSEPAPAQIIQEILEANGQKLLPLVETIQSASQVVNTVIHEIGRQTIETILTLSAEQVAGPRTPGKSTGDIRWHGKQRGTVGLADRRVQVQRPRLRHKTTGEVPIPAHEQLRCDQSVLDQMLGTLLRIFGSTSSWPAQWVCRGAR